MISKLRYELNFKARPNLFTDRRGVTIGFPLGGAAKSLGNNRVKQAVKDGSLSWD
jgi:hypothetical protein